MVNWLTKIVRVQPSYFAFLSGIAISFGTKLAMGLAIEDYKTLFGSFIILPTILFFVAGISFIFLSWTLEEPNIKWKNTNRELWSGDEIRRIALNGKAPILWCLLIIGILAFAGGGLTLIR